MYNGYTHACTHAHAHTHPHTQKHTHTQTQTQTQTYTGKKLISVVDYTGLPNVLVI